MDVLNHLGQAAALLLLLELLVVLIIVLAVAGGLAFGLHWVNGKTEWAFGKVNGYLPLVSRYVTKASDSIALPFIKTAATLTMIGGTISAVERRIRELHPVASVEPVAARPVSPPSEEITEPLVLP